MHYGWIVQEQMDYKNKCLGNLHSNFPKVEVTGSEFLNDFKLL